MSHDKNLANRRKVRDIVLPGMGVGKCSACGERHILGDGLCMKCWDKAIDRGEIERVRTYDRTRSTAAV